MGNVAINLSDITGVAAKVDKVVETTETLLADLEPLESVLPIPASIKTGIADLQKYLALAQGLLAKVS